MIVIIGAGYAGAATARALATRGRGNHVVLLEAESSQGQHASGRNAGLIGALLEDDPVLRKVGVHGLKLLRARNMMNSCGSALLTTEEAVYERLLQRSVRHDLPALGTTTRRLARTIPLLEGAASHLAVICPVEGTVEPSALLAWYLDEAANRGVRVVTDARVTKLRMGEGRVHRVDTTAGSFEAERIVNAAGAWAGEIGRLARAGPYPDLSITRRHLVGSMLPRGAEPDWPFVWDLTHQVYFRRDGERLTLCACDNDPHPAREPDVSDEAGARLARKLEVAFPAIAMTPLERPRACLRTFAPDGRYIIGHDPGVPGLFWVAGLGGSGATASAAVGELAADLLLEEDCSGLPAGVPEAFDPARLAGPDPAT